MRLIYLPKENLMGIFSGSNKGSGGGFDKGRKQAAADKKAADAARAKNAQRQRAAQRAAEQNRQRDAARRARDQKRK